MASPWIVGTSISQGQASFGWNEDRTNAVDPIEDKDKDKSAGIGDIG